MLALPPIGWTTTTYRRAGRTYSDWHDGIGLWRYVHEDRRTILRTFDWTVPDRSPRPANANLMRREWKDHGSVEEQLLERRISDGRRRWRIV